MGDFVRRNNQPDPTFDSICRYCFATVGTRSQISALAEDEARHICVKLRARVQVEPARPGVLRVPELQSKG